MQLNRRQGRKNAALPCQNGALQHREEGVVDELAQQEPPRRLAVLGDEASLHLGHRGKVRASLHLDVDDALIGHTRHRGAKEPSRSLFPFLSSRLYVVAPAGTVHRANFLLHTRLARQMKAGKRGASTVSGKSRGRAAAQGNETRSAVVRERSGKEAGKVKEA
eukprot:2395642-Pleurochrysis_carterae.AAC.1